MEPGSAILLKKIVFLVDNRSILPQTSFSVRSRLSSNVVVVRVLAAALVTLALSSWGIAEAGKSGVARVDFHGWSAIVLSNGAARVVIVPDIARVMEFDLIDKQGQVVRGPFWNHPAIDKNLPADVEGWKNYGGDKAWPSPQSDWPKVAGRSWPPPDGFDATSFAATIQGRRVQLLSPADAIYGVRVRRTISLDTRNPVLRIKTVYEKVRGAPVHMSVWTITQLASPERAFIFLPPHSEFAQGYVNLFPAEPRDLKVEGRLLSLTRNLEKGVKIGTDGSALLWVGEGPDLLIENKAVKAGGSNADWPEQGSRTQIYTNPGDQMKYVEFELLDRLHDLKPGQKASLEAVYTLIPRTQVDPVAEATKVFQQN